MIYRFTGYRKGLSKLVEEGKVSHTDLQRNPDDQPQYEGVVFTDGSVVLRWLTSARSTSVFSSLQDMINIHGHPEYGTIIEWHDHSEVPQEWTKALEAIIGKEECN